MISNTNSFNQLIAKIQDLHLNLHRSAANAVNQMLTIRNRLIGHHKVEFEQNGQDRAEYGSGLPVKLSENISIHGLTAPVLSRCRQFYKTYSWILGTVPQENAMQPTLGRKLSITPVNIISNLSFSHLAELIIIDDALKRTFYEIEAIKGTWSVRELRRQRISELNQSYFQITHSKIKQNEKSLSHYTGRNTHYSGFFSNPARNF